MRAIDLVPGCVGLGLALGVGWGALLMPMGTLAHPGAGFLPFWVAVALGVMSLVLVARTLRPRAEPAVAAPEAADRRRSAGVLGGLVLYSLLLEPVGFLPTTLLLLAGLARMLDASRWRSALIFGALATAGAWALFGRWLGVPLP